VEKPPALVPIELLVARDGRGGPRLDCCAVRAEHLAPHEVRCSGDCGWNRPEAPFGGEGQGGGWAVMGSGQRAPGGAHGTLRAAHAVHVGMKANRPARFNPESALLGTAVLEQECRPAREAPRRDSSTLVTASTGRPAFRTAAYGASVAASSGESDSMWHCSTSSARSRARTPPRLASGAAVPRRSNES
jgi:hypothetical protein